MPEAAAERAGDRSLTWSLEKTGAPEIGNRGSPANMDKLPPRLLGIMAAISFTTWGFLAGSYEVLF